MSLITNCARSSTILLLLLATAAPSFAQEPKQLAYGMLLDSTGSMRSQFASVLNLGKAVVHQTHEHGPISIFDFASEGVGRSSKALPVERLERSQDQDRLDRTIDNLYIQGGQTTLLDAIQFIGERLRQESPNTEQIIILVTDGEERTSQIKQKQLLQQLKDWKIKVFAVGLVKDLESGKRSNCSSFWRARRAAAPSFRNQEKTIRTVWFPPSLFPFSNLGWKRKRREHLLSPNIWPARYRRRL